MQISPHSEDRIYQGITQISSLEDLHRAPRVITVKGWISLAFLALLAVLGVAWSWMGTIPIVVTGPGVFLHKENSPPSVMGFVPLFSGEQVRPGMRALVTLDAIDSAVYGMMEGVVTKVYPYPVSAQDELLDPIPSSRLREYLTQGEIPILLILIEPVADSQTPSGLRWTSKQGPFGTITDGSVGQVDVVLKQVRPISYVIPQS